MVSKRARGTGTVGESTAVRIERVKGLSMNVYNISLLTFQCTVLIQTTRCNYID
jgi:hypothetical protein